MSQSKVKFLFKNNKTTYKLFVAALLDVEALKEDSFKASFLDSDPTDAKLGRIIPEDAFLTTFLDNSQKIIRKIDTIDKRVEKSFEKMILKLSEIYQNEEFLKE